MTSIPPSRWHRTRRRSRSRSSRWIGSGCSSTRTRRVASVNQLVVPAGVPVHFSLTSASVMNAFFIPQLGSMIYTMNGMTTQLNLRADAPGTFLGLSSHYSGDGFSDMHFDVQAVPAERFAAWIEATRNTGPTLDDESYAALAKQSVNTSPFTFGVVESRAVPEDRHAATAAWTWPASSLPDLSVSSLIGTALCAAPISTPRRTTRPSGRSTSMLGKLTWAAIPFDQPIPLFAAALVGVVIIGVLAWITLKGWLPYLWREWITSVDHKRIGIMYILLAMVMLLRGFIDAIMMRSQQALAFHSGGYLPPEHYDQIFSAHGTLMIFFVAMPFVIGLMNFVMPLQLGVRDVAFPTLNSVSFWLTATGALLVNISLVVGEFARTGWLPYPPLSEITYSPGVGVDYYLWALQISGVGTLLTGVNFVTTVLKIHAPGMTYMRMPVFCWTTLASNLLIVAAFPILTATLAMLLLDRYLGFHFFTNEAGGNMMMFMNLIWAWGHPEVYILILPAFGVFSEVISTFSGKPLFGYRSMVMATMAICLLSFTVWLHHFFTMGAGADVNADFRHRIDDHCGADGRKSLQLAVHDVWRPDRVFHADTMVARLYGHVRDRRHDRCPAGRSAGGLRAAQQPFPCRPLPQRHHRRRAVRRVRRLHLLVSEGIRLPAARRT